jgi:hypothetical protein
MIKINFNGSYSAPQRQKIRRAADFFMSQLLTSRKASNTDVVISIKKSIGAEGFCSVHEDEENNYSPKQFQIDLESRKNIKEFLSTLAHEMVHMRQFRNQELGYRENYTRFRGRAYKLSMPYDKQPWEKEAYKLEKVLVKKFEEYCYGI